MLLLLGIVGAGPARAADAEANSAELGHDASPIAARIQDGQDSSRSVLDEVEALREKGELETAVAVARDHLKGQPDDSALALATARLLVELERPEEAIPLYASLYEQEEMREQVLFPYLNLLVHAGRSQEALPLVEQEAKRHPTKRKRLWLVQVARLAGEHDKATATCHDVARTHGWDPLLYRELIASYQAAGNHQEALEWLEKEEEQFDLSFELMIDRAESQRAIGNLQRSRMWYRRAVDSRPSDGAARDALEEVERQIATDERPSEDAGSSRH